VSILIASAQDMANNSGLKYSLIKTRLNELKIMLNSQVLRYAIIETFYPVKGRVIHE